MARSPAYEKFPQHKVEVAPEDHAVRVLWNGRVVADTKRGRRLDEGNYAPAYYVPIEDADPALLERTTHSTHCPFKGDASYYSLRDGETRDENAVWVYETPFDEVSSIRNHIAFYADRVTVEVD